MYFKLVQRHFSAALSFSLLLTCFVVFSLQAQESKTPKHLVSVEALKATINDANQRIIDVRNEVKSYWAGHIPGAVYVNPESLRWSRGGVPVRMMPSQAFAAYLGELGITPDTSIVIYGEDNKSSAAYFFAAALDDIGHTKYAVLEGGFAAWKKADAPMTTDYPAIMPAPYPIEHAMKKSAYASEEEVKKAIADGSALVIDARSVAQYAGESGDFARLGHISGARHVSPDKLTADSGEWKSISDIQAAFREAGVKSDQPVVVYCNTGRSSAEAWFALKNIAGHDNVKIYNGSFSEWVNNPDNPVVKGNEPGAPAAAAEPMADAKGEPVAGAMAPGFTAKDQNGKDVSLADFKGKWVVLYFYPKADTSGCTKEACSFSDNLLHFTNENTVIVGVSGDTVKEQKAFADKYDLRITLLADPDNKIMSAYGVDNKPGEWLGLPFVFARRATFLIDPEGKIAHVWPKVSVSGHTEEVQTKLAELKK